MVVSFVEVVHDDAQHVDVLVPITDPVKEVTYGHSVDVVSGNSVLNAFVGATPPPAPSEGQIWIKF